MKPLPTLLWRENSAAVDVVIIQFFFVVSLLRRDLVGKESV